jgi:hypothetical protein
MRGPTKAPALADRAKQLLLPHSSSRTQMGPPCLSQNGLPLRAETGPLGADRHNIDEAPAAPHSC